MKHSALKAMQLDKGPMSPLGASFDFRNKNNPLMNSLPGHHNMQGLLAEGESPTLPTQ